jgi:toxin CcdB
MAQFRVFRNPRLDSKSRFPLLLDIQSDLISALDTRVVVPLAPVVKDARWVAVLMPIFEIDNKKYAMCTPQLAGVPIAAIGSEVADLSSCRNQIIAALDLMTSGF